MTAAALPYAPSPALTLDSLGPPTRRDDLDGDNWPLTWADDDHLYTAYGDGWGRRPVDPKTKLNTGLVRLTGAPPAFTGEEVAIPYYGGGAQAPNMKGVGLLSVDGVLYHTLRYQVGRTEPRDQVAAALIWSPDHGQTWHGDTAYAERAEDMSWLFHEPAYAFSQPTFLQAGRDYALAQDDYVYLYSPREGRRRRNDSLDLARVPRGHVPDRAAYEYFTGLADTDSDRPTWSRDLPQRAPILTFPDHVGGGDVVFLPNLNRYLAVTSASWHRNEERPSQLAFLDAPHPWGPWTLAGYVDPWGTGLDGDCRYDPRLPAKWIAQTGETSDTLTCTLVFSDRTRSDVLNYQPARLRITSS